MPSATLGLTHRRLITLVALASVSALGLVLHTTFSSASPLSAAHTSDASSSGWEDHPNAALAEGTIGKGKVPGEGGLGGELWREFELQPWEEVRERRERGTFREVELVGDEACLESCESVFLIDRVQHRGIRGNRE